MRFQVTSKLIRPNSWITQTVRQRISNCWARNGESASTESAATDVWNDELTATGGSQMLATRNRGDRHAVISNSSWLPWGRVAMPLISPLMPVPHICVKVSNVIFHWQYCSRLFEVMYSRNA